MRQTVVAKLALLVVANLRSWRFVAGLALLFSFVILNKVKNLIEVAAGFSLRSTDDESR